MAAVLATAMVLAGALAVDVGRAAYVSRDQQGATDRAALDSAQTLRAVDNQASEAAVEEAYAEALASMERNPTPGTQRERTLYRVDLGIASDPDATGFDLVCGAYFDDDGNVINRGDLVDEDGEGILVDVDDDTVDPDSAARWPAPDDCLSREGDEVNAVRVWTFGGLDYVLAIGESGTTMHKIASARATPPTHDEECPEDDPDCFEAEGTFSVGSTLASMDDGLLDQWLIEVIGIDDAAEFGVDLVSYRGVADARVRLGDLVASDSLTVGSVDELLTTDILVTDLIQATIDVLEADGGTASGEVAGELDELLSFMGSWAVGETERKVRLGPVADDEDNGDEEDDGEVEDLGGISMATGASSGADVRVDAIDLVLMAMQMANGDSGVDLTLDVLGEDVSVKMTMIRPPSIETGPRGTQAHSAQVSLDLDLDLDAIVAQNSQLEDLVDSIVDDLLDVLGTLLGGIFGSDPELTLQEVGVHISAAEGTGTLMDIGCETPGQLVIESEVTAGSVAVSGDLYDIDGEMLSFLSDENGDGVSIVLGETTDPAPQTPLDGPFTTGPVRVPDGGAPFSTSLSVDDLTGDLADDLNSQAVGYTLSLLDSALVGAEGVVDDVLDQLGLSLTTVDLMAYDYNCTQVGLQPSTSGDDN